MKKQNGFTLIELMIVVAVIGVLSAIAIPAYQDYVKRSEAASGLATVKSLLTNYDLYEQENGSKPSSLANIGTKSDANKLGTISIPAEGGVKIAFGTAAALSGKHITFTKSAATSSAASTWSCAHDTAVTLKGC